MDAGKVGPLRNCCEVLVRETTRFEKLSEVGFHDFSLERSPPSTKVTDTFLETDGEEPVHGQQSELLLNCNELVPNALASARPAGPPPTITTSVSITFVE